MSSTCYADAGKTYHSIPVCIQPSYWRWTLGFQTCRRHQN